MADDDHRTGSATTQSCSDLQENASALLAGQIEAEDWPPLAAHLENCQACAYFIAETMPSMLAVQQLRLCETTAEVEARALRTFKNTTGLGTQNIDHHDSLRRLQPPARVVQPVVARAPDNKKAGGSEQVRRTCAALCQIAVEESYRVPEKAALIAKAAVLLYKHTEALSEDKDLGARCFQVLAAVSIETTDVSGTQAALQRAFRLFEKGSQPDALKVKLLATAYNCLQTSVSTADADALLREADRVLRETRAAKESRAFQMSVACLRLNSGDLEGAICLLEDMKSAVDERTPLGDQFVIDLNLSLAYCEAGRIELADALQSGLNKKASRLGGTSAIAAYWLEGTRARVKGKWIEALGIFYELRKHFSERGKHVRFLECSLDICRVYAARGAWQEMGVVVRDTVSKLRVSCDNPEIQKALTLLEEGVSARALSESQIKVLSVLVRRASGRGVAGLAG